MPVSKEKAKNVLRKRLRELVKKIVYYESHKNWMDAKHRNEYESLQFVLQLAGITLVNVPPLPPVDPELEKRFIQWRVDTEKEEELRGKSHRMVIFDECQDYYSEEPDPHED